MRMHCEPSLEGCTAEMQLGRSSFEAPHAARCATWLAPPATTASRLRGDDGETWLQLGTFCSGTAPPIARYPRHLHSPQSIELCPTPTIISARTRLRRSARRGHCRPGPKLKQRTVARVYHLLAKEAALTPNVHHLEDFRSARRLERQVRR